MVKSKDDAVWIKTATMEEIISNLVLTEPEKLVGWHKINGDSNKVISKEMNLSVYKVRTHVNSIKKKVNVETDFRLGCVLAAYFKALFDNIVE